MADLGGAFPESVNIGSYKVIGHVVVGVSGVVEGVVLRYGEDYVECLEGEGSNGMPGKL